MTLHKPAGRGAPGLEAAPGETIPEPRLVLEIKDGRVPHPAQGDLAALKATPGWAKPIVEAALRAESADGPQLSSPAPAGARIVPRRDTTNDRCGPAHQLCQLVNPEAIIPLRDKCCPKGRQLPLLAHKRLPSLRQPGLAQSVREDGEVLRTADR